MRISRIAFTPVKGGRHLTHDAVELSAAGPVGDREFALVDRSRGRVLRTVENPSLLRACARWEAGVLSVELDGHTVEEAPGPSGETYEVDYWGRTATLQGCEGPWARAYSDLLGLDVVLCRCARPGQVVYGASVTIVTTSSLSLLSRTLGREVDDARFRSTFLVETGDAPAHLEDWWAGRELRVGEATVRVRGVVPRCAVIDLNPVTGRADAPALRTLSGYRRSGDEIGFGVDAVVTTPGGVRTGDQVVVGVA